MNNEKARYMMISYATQLLLRHTNCICNALLKTGKIKGVDAANLEAIIEMQECMQRTIAQMPIEIEAPKFNGVSDAAFTEIRLNRERGMYEIVETHMEDVDVKTMPVPPTANDEVAVKKSTIETIAAEIMRDNLFLMNFANHRDIAIYFASLYINYSDHDKRDLIIRLVPFAPNSNRIKWAIFADHEIVDSGVLIIDKDAPC